MKKKYYYKLMFGIFPYTVDDNVSLIFLISLTLYLTLIRIYKYVFYHDEDFDIRQNMLYSCPDGNIIKSDINIL